MTDTEICSTCLIWVKLGTTNLSAMNKFTSPLVGPICVGLSQKILLQNMLSPMKRESSFRFALWL